MSLSAYPQYKQTGIPWLGELPQDWSIKKIKHSTYLKGRVGWKGLTSEEYLDDGYAYLVTGTDFSTKFIDWRACHCVDQVRYEDDPFIQLQDGDLLITKDGTIGKLAIVSGLDRPACLNSGIFLVRPKSDYTTEFMFWVLQSESFARFCDLSSMGSTIQHLYQNVFEDFSFPVPSKDEQSAIVATLNRETSKIDALVAEQEKLLTLLAEKRQATILHAVTRGLNPDAPTKDSGVAWLGEVPAHWSVCTLRRTLLRIEQGWSPECINRPSDGTEWGVLKTGCVNGGIFNAVENKALPETLEPVAALEVRDGDLLMSRASGSPKLVGSVAYISKPPSRLMLSDKIFRLHLRRWVLPRFFAVALNSAALRLQIEASISGAEGLANNLPQSSLKDFWVAVPPRQEQEEIVAFVDAETRKLDALRTNAERAIELLKERRSALIAAAVTGKIDVRNVLRQELAA